MTAVEARVTIVVLTHNRRDELCRTLAHLTALPECPSIIVVDNASSDDTAFAVRSRFPAVRIIRLPHNIGAAARNLGVQSASTPYVALCDDDTWWTAGSLPRAADVFDAEPRLAVAVAAILVGPADRLDPTSAEMARSPLPTPPGAFGRTLLGFMAGASVIRRSAFLEVRGFHPAFFIGGEESLVTLDLASAGWRIAYLPRLNVHHHPSNARDTTTRSALLLRNQLWVTIMRRSLRTAANSACGLTRQALHDPAARSALRDTIRRLPWLLEHRMPISTTLERQLRVLEHHEPLVPLDGPFQPSPAVHHSHP